MKRLSLAISFIRSSLFTNVIIIAQLFLLIFMMNYAFMPLLIAQKAKDAIEYFDFDNMLVFSPADRFDFTMPAEFGGDEPHRLIYKELEKLEGQTGLGRVRSAEILLPSGVQMTVTMYNANLMERIDSEYDEGEGDGKISLIIGKNFAEGINAGQVAQIFDYLGTSENFCINNVKIANRARLPILNVYSGSDLTISDLFSGAPSVDDSIITCFTDNENIPIIGGNDHPCVMVFTDEKLDTSEYKVLWQKELDKTQLGTLYTIDDLYANESGWNLSLFGNSFILTGLLLLLSIFGIGGNNILSYIAIQREMGLNFMFGMKWQTGMSVILCAFALNVMIPTIPALICSDIFVNASGVQNADWVTAESAFMTLLVTVGVYLLTSLGVYGMMAKTKPINLIRRNR